MIIRLRANLPDHNIIEENSAELFIVDYTHFGGNVELLNHKPEVEYVYIENQANIPVYFDGFGQNALRRQDGTSCRQCECIMFPKSCDETDWVLMVEMKYVSSIENAFRVENNYPYCMIDQIIQTVEFFRSNGILNPDRRVNAIVSFPTLIEDFSASFFTGDWSIEDILLKHKIKMRATNSGRIISNKRIVI